MNIQSAYSSHGHPRPTRGSLPRARSARPRLIPAVGAIAAFLVLGGSGPATAAAASPAASVPAAVCDTASEGIVAGPPAASASVPVPSQRTVAPSTSPEGPAVSPETAHLGGRWRRLARSPFGAEYAISAWTGERVLVVDPRSRRTAAWDPARDRWRELERAPHRFDSFSSPAVWTGRELIVLGGSDDTMRPVAFDPGTDRWREAAPAPIGAAEGAVWTGDRMVAVTHEGAAAAYVPDADCWMALPRVPGDGGVESAHWTGTHVLVETVSAEATPDGGRQLVVAVLDPLTWTWSAGSPSPTPIAHGVSGSWVDGRLVFLNWWPDPGVEGDSVAWDPSTDSWRPVSLRCRATTRDTTAADSLLIAGDAELAFDPVSGTCYRLPRPPVGPFGRAARVWTGSELVLWSGTRTEDGPTVRIGLAYRPPDLEGASD